MKNERGGFKFDCNVLFLLGKSFKGTWQTVDLCLHSVVDIELPFMLFSLTFYIEVFSICAKCFIISEKLEIIR